MKFFLELFQRNENLEKFAYKYFKELKISKNVLANIPKNSNFKISSDRLLKKQKSLKIFLELFHRNENLEKFAYKYFKELKFFKKSAYKFSKKQ